MTGLVGKISHLVNGLTDGQQFLTLLVTAAVTVVLGLGMPTPAAYILAAALMTPILTGIGVDVLTANMFVLYYAVMSALTPPVAVAAYAASSLAEDNPLYIAVLAVKFALGAFVVPFAFVYGPELLMQGPPLEIGLSMVTAVAGLIFVASAIEAYLAGPMTRPARLLIGVGGMALVIPDIRLSAIGVVLVAIASGPILFRRLLTKTAPPP